MLKTPKSVPSKYFYDDVGSCLYDEICRVPEYYPMRYEMSILENKCSRILEFFKEKEGDLVEIGSGSDIKIRLFLNACTIEQLTRIRYVPMDISAACLIRSSQRLAEDYPDLTIHGMAADFTRQAYLLPKRRKMIIFLGGTFGNFPESEAVALLRRFADVMTPEDHLLIGMDLIKQPEIIEAAYNDAMGVTAQFNLNILNNINAHIQSDFIPENFEHVAFFNREMAQIEMHLRARKKMQINFSALDFSITIREGEMLKTEISRKFSRSSAENLFRKADMQVHAWHTDPQEWLAIAEIKRLK